MPYNQALQGEVDKNYGVRLDISKDSISDLTNVVNLDKNPLKLKTIFENPENAQLLKRIKNICIIWRKDADEILMYKKWSVDIILEQKKDKKCQKCN